MFEITSSLHIPSEAISVRFARASGPGGQHVNRRESAAQLFFDTHSLPSDVRKRLCKQQPGRISRNGMLVLRADGQRSQRRNREEVLARLRRLISQAVDEPATRVQTAPSSTANERRLASKRRRGELKRLRGKVSQVEEERSSRHKAHLG